MAVLLLSYESHSYGHQLPIAEGAKLYLVVNIQWRPRVVRSFESDSFTKYLIRADFLDMKELNLPVSIK